MDDDELQLKEQGHNDGIVARSGIADDEGPPPGFEGVVPQPPVPEEELAVGLSAVQVVPALSPPLMLVSTAMRQPSVAAPDGVLVVRVSSHSFVIPEESGTRMSQ